MGIEHLDEIGRNEVVRKRLAKLMARDCFRNTKLEDLHAGTSPSSETGDYSDVKVVSPFGWIGGAMHERELDSIIATIKPKNRRSNVGYAARNSQFSI